MLMHNLIIAWRNIVRNRFYSLILILGFAIGIAASILLLFYTYDELSFDSFHKNKNRIFLVGVDSKEDNETQITGWTTPPTGPALKDYFHEIESFTRLCFWFDEVLVSKDDQQFVEHNIIGADSSVFKIFDIPFIAGNPETALKEPNSIVITEDVAKKYFKGENPMGKTLKFEHFFSACTVTGVVKNYPENSHFDFDMLLSMSSLKNINFNFTESWDNHTFSTYVLLRENADPEYLSSKFPEFLKFYMEPFLLKKFNKSFDEIYKSDSYNLFLTPIEDVHLSTLIFDNQEGKKSLTYAVGIIGLIIIIMVCVNYLNLNIALSIKRTKETGIRKVSGSSRFSIIYQFLIESVLTVLFALIVGILLIELVLPVFNSVAQKSLSINYSNPLLIAGLLIFAVVLGILSGYYPALLISSFKPVSALKGEAKIIGRKSLFGSALIIFQFSICIFMIVATIIVYKQLSFMTNKNLGFNKENILVVKRPFILKGNHEVFKNSLLQNSDITNVGYTNTIPGRNFDGHGQHFSGDPAEKRFNIMPLWCDENTLEILGLEITEGRKFNSNDKNVAILNEAAVHKYNLQDPLNKIIDSGTMGDVDISITGVAKDFHFQSFHNKIEPLVIYKNEYNQGNIWQADYVLIKMKGEDPIATVRYVENQWKSLTNNYLFEYTFLDQDFNKLFERELITSRIFTVFSVISIVITCLGLLGMATLYAEKRKKEIGIRKVNGAGLFQLITLLNKDFSVWLLISFIIAAPAAWYITNRWLENFIYKTSLSWWIFLAGGCITLAIALFAVSWQSYKAAAANPINSLKND